MSRKTRCKENDEKGPGTCFPLKEENLRLPSSAEACRFLIESKTPCVPEARWRIYIYIYNIYRGGGLIQGSDLGPGPIIQDSWPRPWPQAYKPIGNPIGNRQFNRQFNTICFLESLAKKQKTGVQETPKDHRKRSG